MPRIACPQCAAVLKLKDASLLGKPGKCPKCGHRFVLKEPPERPKPDGNEERPVVAKKPKAVRRVREDSEGSPVADPATAATKTPPEEKKVLSTSMETGGFPNIDAGDSGPAGTSRMRELARKRAQTRRRGMMVLGAIGLCVIGVVWAGMSFGLRPSEKRVETADPPPKINQEYVSQRDHLEQVAKLIRQDSPTQGKPVTLDYVPPGASIVIHLHPARLWKAGSAGEELRYCLGKAFNTWLTESITKYCGLPPEKIGAATICLELGARGMEPNVSTVVWPIEPLKTSELIQRFDGDPQVINGTTVFVGPERAAVVGEKRDEQKRPLLYATAPAADAQLLAMSVARPGITSEAVMQMLSVTDRQRDITIVFQPSDLKIHEKTLFGPEFASLMTAFRGYFDDQIEAAAWSLHFTNDEFVSELALRSGTATTPQQTLSAFTGHLDSLAVELVELVSTMNPRALGDRKLIGRLPAMVEVVDAVTVGGIDERLALLQARLPQRAAPNLALASLLTWHESKRTPPGSPSAEPTGQAPAKTLAERLKKPIDIDFRRTPLEGAFQYIGEQTGVTFVVDGAGLKLSGYTRNMPQEFALGMVPAEQAIAHIINTENQEDLAVVLDEKEGVAIVTTDEAAKKKGQTPATFVKE